MPVIYNEPLPVHEVILNNVMGQKKKLVEIKEASKELTRPITVTGVKVMKLPLCVKATKNVTLKRAMGFLFRLCFPFVCKRSSASPA